MPPSVSLAGPAMPVPWPPSERRASPGAAPPLPELRSFSLYSFPSVHHLSLSKGRSWLQVTQSASVAGNGQELWRIGTAQRKGAIGAQHPQLPATTAWAAALRSCPTRSSGDGEDSGNEGSCTPKPFWFLGPKGLQALRCSVAL